MESREWQFDGIVGPTHNYAGLALGNLAAAKNKGAVSNPRSAALQGLEKMRFVRNLGMRQAFLPPHYRPLVGELRRAGFTGNLGEVLDSAFQQAPGLLASVFSSAFMWSANTGTVTPSADSDDGKLHFTPANLSSHFHRSLEGEFAQKIARNIFHNQDLFCVHNVLSPANGWGDEGAANHMRINCNNNEVATNIFVYGKSHDMHFKSEKFTPRQERLASEAIARLHGLKAGQIAYLQQAPAAIDAGVFHNDVIALNTTSRMVIHEQAFIPDHKKWLHEFAALQPEFLLREISSAEISLSEAVNTYLFNSQLLHRPCGKFALVAPSECGNHAVVAGVVTQLISEGAIDEVHYLDVRESMRNGGGPACLRLRVVLTPEQEQAMHQSVVLTDDMYTRIVEWVNRHYRDRLQFDDLRDPSFVNELDAAYGELETLLSMPGLYDGYRIQAE
ncbi:MAG: N-succinylarginine dihydrolase [Rickettsiales bacterium]